MKKLRNLKNMYVVTDDYGKKAIWHDGSPSWREDFFAKLFNSREEAKEFAIRSGFEQNTFGYVWDVDSVNVTDYLWGLVNYLDRRDEAVTIENVKNFLEQEGLTVDDEIIKKVIQEWENA